MSKAALLDSLVGKEIQIKFKGEIGGPPVGPGKLERHVVMREPDAKDVSYYKLLTEAIMGADPKTARQVLYPIIFEADDVLWINDGYTQIEQSRIDTLGGQRTPGGIVIGGS